MSEPNFPLHWPLGWPRTTNRHWSKFGQRQERWGVGSVEQAFAGYAALPAKSHASMWELLGIGNPEGASEATVLNAWRERAQECHPDKPGGSHEAMTALNEAKDIALATIRERRRA